MKTSRQSLFVAEGVQRSPYKTEAVEADPALVSDFTALVQQLYRALRLRLASGNTISVIYNPPVLNAVILIKQAGKIIPYELSANPTTAVTVAIMAGVRVPDHSSPKAMHMALVKGFAHIYKGTTPK